MVAGRRRGWLGGLGDLIKLPAILADVAVGYLVHQLVVELGGSRRAALLGALLFVVNPVTWFDSAVWAQVDSFGLVFLLLGLRELWRDHPERAAILATIAAVIKPQLGILIPILVAVLLKRYLIDPLRDQPGADQPGDPAHPTGRLGRGPIRLVSSGLLALATAAACVRRSACRSSTCSGRWPRPPAATRTSRSMPTTRGPWSSRPAAAWPGPGPGCPTSPTRRRRARR